MKLQLNGNKNLLPLPQASNRNNMFGTTYLEVFLEEKNIFFNLKLIYI